MVLQTIELLDFQAHSSLSLRFTPGINTIRGATDKGKSAVIRALQWACLNALSGDGFIREGAKKATVNVTVVTKEGTYVISRSKSQGGVLNTYEMGDEVYRSFGTSVPPDIQKVLGLGDINFQGQHDSPFWFSDTAGEVSRKLNAVVDLGIIDTALSNTQGRLRTATDQVSFVKERLDKAKEELEEVEGQEARISEFANLQKLYDTHSQLMSDSSKLEDLITNLRSHREKIKRRTSQVEEGEALIGKARVYFRTLRRKESLEEILKEARRLQAIKAPPDFSDLEQKYQLVGALKKKILNLSSLITRIGERRLLVTTLTEALEKKERDFQQKTKGNRCPLCGQKM